MKRYFLDEMTWREAEARRRESNIAIIPVGSVEVHGPHLLLGCDTYIAQALAYEVAQRIGAVITPAISMTYSGGTKPFTGTISLPLPMMTDYLKSVCTVMIEQGFERTMIVEWHAPYIAGQMVSREIFGERGVPVLFYGPCILPESLHTVFGEKADGAAMEASLLLGALKILGKEDLLDLSGITEDSSVEPRPPFIQKIAATRAWFGHYYDHDTQHVAPRKGTSADLGAKAIRHSAGIIGSIGDDWAQYLAYAAEKQEQGWEVRE